MVANTTFQDLLENQHGGNILFRGMKEVDVRIRRALGLHDYQAVVDLQKEIWGYTELEEIAAMPMLMIANRFGGCLLVAEESTGKLIGFSFAKPGWTRDKRRLWWSHMTGVTQEYRNRGIGLGLKAQQRKEALQEGVELILWTFDPLQAMNAHFNIHKLGVIVRQYEENVYGQSLSPLHRGLPTDRFIAEWHLNSDRVKDRLGNGEAPVIIRDVTRIPRILVVHGSEPDVRLDAPTLLLEAPVEINQLKLMNFGQAKDWQDRIRTGALHYLHAGYVVTDFVVLKEPQPQAFYVLERQVFLN